jgi:hypothetical protein
MGAGEVHGERPFGRPIVGGRILLKWKTYGR